MLKDKTILITGALGLMGQEITKALMSFGATVIMADINEKKGKELLSQLKNSHLYFYKADITSEKSVSQLIKEVLKKHKKIDGLVNNAYPRNKQYGKKLEKVSLSSFNENVALHLGGYFNCMKQFAVVFKKQGFGSMVSMSSIYGVTAPRFQIYENTDMTMPVEYAAIKSAIIHLTKYFARYYQGVPVRFNCVSPGGISNNQSAKFIRNYVQWNTTPKMLYPKDIVGTVAFLLSDNAIAINGQNIVVDDGWIL